MSPRDRILARRAKFVAAAVALVGCRDPEPPPPRTATGATPPTDALAQPPTADGVHDAERIDSGPPGLYGSPFICLQVMWVPHLEIRPKLHFASGVSAVAKESAPILDEVAATLKQHGNVLVELHGHSDPGEAAGIGLARARAVRDALVNRGIDGTRLTLRDLGNSAPVEKGAHERNRRVEFVTVAPPP